MLKITIAGSTALVQEGPGDAPTPAGPFLLLGLYLYYPGGVTLSATGNGKRGIDRPRVEFNDGENDALSR